MKEWYEIYEKCPDYSQEVTEQDIFGHDSFQSYCKGKRIIPCIQCRKCIEKRRKEHA